MPPLHPVWPPAPYVIPTRRPAPDAALRRARVLRTFHELTPDEQQSHANALGERDSDMLGETVTHALESFGLAWQRAGKPRGRRQLDGLDAYWSLYPDWASLDGRVDHSTLLEMMQVIDGYNDADDLRRATGALLTFADERAWAIHRVHRFNEEREDEDDEHPFLHPPLADGRLDDVAQAAYDVDVAIGAWHPNGRDDRLELCITFSGSDRHGGGSHQLSFSDPLDSWNTEEDYLAGLDDLVEAWRDALETHLVSCLNAEEEYLHSVDRAMEHAEGDATAFDEDGEEIDDLDLSPRERRAVALAYRAHRRRTTA